jgi:hypothetical protein
LLVLEVALRRCRRTSYRHLNASSFVYYRVSRESCVLYCTGTHLVRYIQVYAETRRGSTSSDYIISTIMKIFHFSLRRFPISHYRSMPFRLLITKVSFGRALPFQADIEHARRENCRSKARTLQRRAMSRQRREYSRKAIVQDCQGKQVSMARGSSLNSIAINARDEKDGCVALLKTRLRDWAQSRSRLTK